MGNVHPRMSFKQKLQTTKLLGCVMTTLPLHPPLFFTNLGVFVHIVVLIRYRWPVQNLQPVV